MGDFFVAILILSARRRIVESRTEEIENADVRLGVPPEIVRVEIGV